MADPRTRENEPADGPTTQKWLADNPGEVPHEWRDEADGMGYGDLPDSMLRELLEMDPDLLGDWDRFQ